MDKDAAVIVKDWRLKVGLTQEQLGKALQLSQSHVSDIEKGMPISKRVAKKLAVLTGEALEIFIK